MCVSVPFIPGQKFGKYSKNKILFSFVPNTKYYACCRRRHRHHLDFLLVCGLACLLRSWTFVRRKREDDDGYYEDDKKWINSLLLLLRCHFLGLQTDLNIIYSRLQQLSASYLEPLLSSSLPLSLSLYPLKKFNGNVGLIIIQRHRIVVAFLLRVLLLAGNDNEMGRNSELYSSMAAATGNCTPFTPPRVRVPTASKLQLRG